MTSPVAVFDGIDKSYGPVAALRDVSFRIEAGERVALLGANGAGKSTALNILLGLRRPDRGTVRLFDQDPRRPDSRRRLGATPQDTGFPELLTVREILDLVAAHYEAPDRDGAIEALALQPFLEQRAGGLSGGQRRLLAVAVALVGGHDALVLDEPSVAMDLETRRTTWQVLRRRAEAGTTLLLSSHHMDEVEALAERVILIDGGRIAADGDLAAIRARVGRRLVRYRGPAVPRCEGIERAESEGDRQVLTCRDSDAVVQALVEQDLPFDDLSVTPLDLGEAIRLILEEGS